MRLPQQTEVNRQSWSPATGSKGITAANGSDLQTCLAACEGLTNQDLKPMCQALCNSQYP